MEHLFKDHPQLLWNSKRIAENIIPAYFAPAALLRRGRLAEFFWI